MTKEELWTLLANRNPRFVTGPIAFAPKTLRRLFDLVWDQATLHAEEYEGMPPEAPPPGTPTPGDPADFVEMLRNAGVKI